MINDNAIEGASDGLSKDGTSRESSIAQKNHSLRKIVGKRS
jgi:hypothetical protein